MISIRIRKEGGKVVAYIEQSGANPGSGLRIPEGTAWAIDRGMPPLELFAVCNEVGMSDGQKQFERVR